MSLPGGVGRAGDHYERQADQVAAHVVQGRSAASLLSGSGGGATYAQSVQRSPIVQRLEGGDRPFSGGYDPLVCRGIYLDAKSTSGATLDGTEQADYDYITGAGVEIINVLEKEDTLTEWSARCGDLSLSYSDVKPTSRRPSTPGAAR